MRLTNRFECILPVVLGLVIVFAHCGNVAGQEIVNGSSAGEFIPEIPASYSDSGSFFSRQLGTVLRFNYHTEGYGVQDDVVSLGGMKVISLSEGSTWFLDGQGTLSDDFGGGFNLGVGYRELVQTGWGYDPQRILGASFWTDGQSTSADNFFAQLGFGLESLGDSYDLRLNGYFPLDRTERSDPYLINFDELNYMENGLFSGLEAVTIDTAHTVVDAEFAKRINNLEAWAFLGGYQIGGGAVDATGYRIGVRGYAVPDLALSLQVTDDDVYHTNVMFGLTWFVGRTHKCNQPCGNILDRFREPVLRNDFIVTTQETITQVAGDPLTDAETNEQLFLIHVDSDAGAGGDGTFENPVSTLTEAEVLQIDNAKILVYSDSVLTDDITLQLGVDLLGEGVDAEMEPVNHLVDTVERGLVTLPETSPGASMGATPMINSAALATAITFGDNTTANNFEINGGGTAALANGIVAPADSMLSNMRMSNQTGDAVLLTDISGSLIIDNSNFISGAGGAGVHVFGGEDGMSINAEIENFSSSALIVENRTGGTFTYGGILDDDGGTGISVLNNVDSTLLFTNATEDEDNGIDILASGAGDAITITGNTNSIIEFTGTVGVSATGTNDGVVIASNDVDTGILFSDLDATAVDGVTVSISDGGAGTTSAGDGIIFSSADEDRTIANTGAGTAVEIIGNGGAEDDNATVTINSDVENMGGGLAVHVHDRLANDVTFNGTVDASGFGGGILIEQNDEGNITFNGIATLDTSTNNGVTLDTNADTVIGFNGLDIMTTSGTGFMASGGGTLFVNSPDGENRIETSTGTALDLNGMTIDAAGVTFDEINVTNGAAKGIVLTDIDGDGQINFGMGDDPGDGGTLFTADTAIEVDNVNTLVVDNVIIANGSGAGVDVTNQEEDSSVTFNSLQVTTSSATGVNIHDNIDGTIAFNDLLAEATSSGDAVVVQNNMDATITFDGVDIDTSSGTGFTASGDGNLSVVNTSGDNTIDTDGGGTALDLNGVSVAAAGITFDTINVSNGTNVGISLVDVAGAGQVSLGATGNPGDGGTVDTTGDGIFVSDVDDLIVDNINVDVSGSSNGVEVTAQEAGSTATFNGIEATAVNGNAVRVVDNINGDITFNDLDATTTGTGDAVFVMNNMDATVTINGMEATATGSGKGFTATGSGNLVATGTNSITSDTGIGLEIDGQTIGAGGATFSEVNSGDSGTAASQGIVLKDITGSALTVGSGTNPGDGGTLFTNGTAITVDNVTNVTFNNVIVDNDAAAALGAGIDLMNNDSGTVTFNDMDIRTFDDTAVNVDGNGGATINFNDLTANTTAGTADAVVVQNNTSGQFNFNDSDIDTMNGRGVFVDANGTATTSFVGFDIDTTMGSGDGFTATGTGTLAASGTNNITTEDGVGLTITDTNIAAGGASFTSVNVDGAMHAVVLDNLTGGEITVGSTSTASVMENITDDAIQITNVANVDVVNVNVTNATGNGLTVNNDNASAMDVTVDDLAVNSASGGGIEVNHTGGGDFTMLVDNSDIDSIVDLDLNGAGDVDFTFDDSFVDTTVMDSAFTFALGPQVEDANVRIRRNEFTSVNATAFDMEITSAASKTVNFLFDDNDVSNNSTSVAAEFDASQATIFNATITDNNFDNANGGADEYFDIASNSATTVINMNLNNNTADGGSGDFTLHELNGSDFNIQDRDTVEARNNGNFTFDSLPAGNVTDFDNINSVPLPP